MIQKGEKIMKFTFRAYNVDDNFTFDMELFENEEICIDSSVKVNDEFIKFEKLAEKVFWFDSILLVNDNVFDNLTDDEAVYRKWDEVSDIRNDLYELSDCLKDILKQSEKIQNLHYSENTDRDFEEIVRKWYVNQKLAENLAYAIDSIELPDGY